MRVRHIPKEGTLEPRIYVGMHGPANRVLDGLEILKQRDLHPLDAACVDQITEANRGDRYMGQIILEGIHEIGLAQTGLVQQMHGEGNGNLLLRGLHARQAGRVYRAISKIAQL